MVDFVKRAHKTGDIDPDEQVLAGFNATPAPFGMANAGMIGGFIAGGAIGMAAGAALDGWRSKKDDADAEERDLPDLADRAPFEPAVPENGSLFAVTTKRIALWRIAGLGKPREMLFSIPLADIDRIAWQIADTKWLGGRPASLVMWIGVAGTHTLPCAGIAMGAAGKYVKQTLAALEERLPGRVVGFEG